MKSTKNPNGFTTLLSELINEYNKMKDDDSFIISHKNIAIENMIKFINIASCKEIIKLYPIYNAIREKSYISAFEMTFIQTRFYNLVKYNSFDKGMQYTLDNKSYILGFIEETKKGYHFVRNPGQEKPNVNKDLSKYDVSENDKIILERLMYIIKKFTDKNEKCTNTLNEHLEKYSQRSLSQIKNSEVQKLPMDKKYSINYFDEIVNPENAKIRQHAIDVLKGNDFLLFAPKARNEAGRIYNPYFNALKKVDKIGLFPDTDSYDINASVYQFLFQFAEEKNLSNIKVKNYIEEKEAKRLIWSKDFFNHLPFKIFKYRYELDKIQDMYVNDDFVDELINEIYTLVMTIKDKEDSLFALYETWEKKQIQNFIKGNNLKLGEYSSNHDEVLVNTKVKIDYVPSIFGKETNEERKEILKEYKEQTLKDFKIKVKKKREKKEQENFIRNSYGVYRRCKTAKAKTKWHTVLVIAKDGVKEEAVKSCFTISF